MNSFEKWAAFAALGLAIGATITNCVQANQIGKLESEVKQHKGTK